jgi:hypothetical protein
MGFAIRRLITAQITEIANRSNVERSCHREILVEKRKKKKEAFRPPKRLVFISLSESAAL